MAYDETNPPPDAPPESWLASEHRRSDGPRSPARRALPWIVGAAVVLTIAVIAGYGTSYLLANLQRVPAPVGALQPSPTASATPPAGSPAPRSGAPEVSPVATRPPLATRPPRETPAGTPRVHVVARGESLSLIAEQYDVDIQAIIVLNDLNNPNLIVPGQVLLIPPPDQ